MFNFNVLVHLEKLTKPCKLMMLSVSLKQYSVKDIMKTVFNDCLKLHI